jgi:hypothetical protein
MAFYVAPARSAAITIRTQPPYGHDVLLFASRLVQNSLPGADVEETTPADRERCT